MDTDRLWSKLDAISNALNDLTTAFRTFQENVEGRLSRIDEKYEELRNEQNHAKGSRSKIFTRIEKHEGDTQEQLRDLEKRIDSVELAPAKKALARDDDNADTIRREVIKRLTNMAVGLVLILVFLFGSNIVLKDFSAVLPPRSTTETVKDNPEE